MTRTVAAIRSALEAAGVTFLDSGDVVAGQVCRCVRPAPKTN